MQISAGQVKSLRESTGAGMMECKKALVETNGDFDKAVLFLRERGLAAAKKKAGRVASEGVVGITLGENFDKAVILELNCETDFVANNEQFQVLTNDFLTQIANNDYQDVEAFLSTPSLNDNSKTNKNVLDNAIASIGENLSLRRFTKVGCSEKGYVNSYTHGNGRIGVIVEFETKDEDLKQSKEFYSFSKDICMHIAAAKPLYKTSDEVPAEIIEQEKAIYKKQLANQGKPENILDKIVEGKLQKYYKDVCLLDQPFVKEDKKSINDVLKEAKNQFQTTVEIKRFVRYELGEGIEKKQQSLADEVASLTK